MKNERAVDIHQHLWPEPLLAALARRAEPPLLHRTRDGWMLRAPGEAAAPLRLSDHDPVARARLVREDRLGLAVIAPSTPLGIESLPEGEALGLLAAYHEGVAELPPEFGAWAAVNVGDPDPDATGRLLDDGFVGVCVPAGAIADRDTLERLGSVLELLARQDAALFVHPGPPSRPSDAGPPWWSAMTAYVFDMQAAWHAWRVWGRPAHPRLKVCFAMLAGLAPLQRERLEARSGRVAHDPLSFLDTSSYGPRAIDAVLREVGADVLVYGSDRPVIEPVEDGLGDALAVTIRTRGPAALLQITTQGVCA